MSYGTCKMCGCTDNDCRQCIKKTGKPCYWVDNQHEICSACMEEIETLLNELHNDMAKSIIEMEIYMPLSKDLLIIKDKIRLLNSK